MIKVMVADDEFLEREVYKVLISKYFDGLQVVAEAETGRQAIELYDLHRPDLVLMDVKMPGINGIEAIEEIRKRSGNAKFVIISAYNFFDYAKEALKHGVEEYLLKPVAKDEFIKVMHNVLNKIHYERKTNQEELEMKERLRSILPILESEFTFAIMMSDDSKIDQYSTLLDIDISQGYIAIGRVNENSFLSADHISRNLTIKKMQEYIKENMPELKPCLISNFISNKILFVFPDHHNSCYEIKEDAYKKMLKIRNSIKDSFQVDMYFGISEPYKHISKISNSYNQALTVVNNIDSFYMDIVNYDDIKYELKKEFHYPYEIEKLLIEKIRLGLTEEAVKSFVAIFDCTTESLKDDVNRVKFELLELYFLLSRMTYDEDCDFIGLKDFVISKDKYYNSVTIKEIYHIFEEDIRDICKKFKEDRSKMTKSILFDAIQYVKENYMKEITLDEVAKRVCVSPNYFSRMFKNEFNQSFIDYLTNVRIETAKKIISNTDKNICDICWEVGYNDPNYFTKVFKKVVGLTPSEYKGNKPK
ncbi:response regulator [Oscillospiraceae bacterium PP1C4]